jgi:hypothetical protein
MSWPRRTLRWPTVHRLGYRYQLRLKPIEFLDAELLDPAEEAKGEEYWFFDCREAERFFLSFLEDGLAAQTIRDFAAHELRTLHWRNLNGVDDFELAEGLAWIAVREKLFRVVRFHEPLPHVPFPKLPERPAPPFLVQEPKLSSIGLQVLWDDTGEPVGGLPVVVETAGNTGSGRMCVTGSDGLARLDVPPGRCEVRCSFKDLAATDCAVFVGLRDTPERSAASGQRHSTGPSPKAVVQVERRKVRTGETLESIAREAGLQWQDLAFFNWGTKVPEEINEHLAAEVGCTEKTGKNFVFDDSDRPGVILVPRQWKQPGLASARNYQIRVRPVGSSGVIRVTLDIDPRQAAASHSRFRLATEDGSFEQEKSVADDLVEGDELLDFEFTDCPVDQTYSLEIVREGSEPVRIFEGASFDELHDSHEGEPRA